MNAEQRRHQIKFFINKFEATREDEWCTYIRHNELGQRCALGMTHPPQRPWDDTDETRALKHVFAQEDDFNPYFDGGCLVAEINNGDDHRCQQLTPRSRMLAALYDLLKL